MNNVTSQEADAEVINHRW